MQRVKQLFDDESGVSPVIGVILMVAITVILAAVIASFVLGLGDSADDVQPNVQISDSTEHFEEGDEEVDDLIDSPPSEQGNVTLFELEVGSADADADPDDFRIDIDGLDNDIWGDQNDIDAGDSFFLVVTDITDEGDIDTADHIGDIESQLEDTDEDYLVVAGEDGIEYGDEFDIVFDTEETSSIFDTYELPELDDLR